MATALTSCFNYCIDGSSSFFKTSFYTERLTSFCTNPENKLTKKVTSTTVYSKFLKFANSILEMGEELSDSKETIEGIATTREFVTVTRDGMGILNVANGAIPRLIGHLQNLYFFVANQKPAADDEDALKIWEGANKKAQYVHGEDATVCEKVAFVIEQVGKAVGNLIFIFAFGVSKPIDLVYRYISKSINPVAAGIGKAFPKIWFGNHVSGFIGHGGAIAYQTLSFDRLNRVPHEYASSMVENGLGVFAKICEITQGGFKLAEHVLPIEARLFLSVSASFFDLAKELWSDK